MGEKITRTVGRGQRHKKKDVKIIQSLLNKHIKTGLLALQGIDVLLENGRYDKKMEAAIKAFQLRMYIWPDRKISPTGRTLIELNKEAVFPNFGAVHALFISAMSKNPPKKSGMDKIPVDLWSAALLSLLSQSNNTLISKPKMLTLIDFRLDNTKKRMWVVDLKKRKIHFNTVVSHGKGSGKGRKATSFNNVSGENKSSLGGYATLYTRQAVAGSKGRTKKRQSLVVEGLEKTNNKARNRGILFHGAYYVSKTRAAYSKGCFATEQSVNDKLIKLIKHGSFVYVKG